MADLCTPIVTAPSATRFSFRTHVAHGCLLSLVAVLSACTLAGCRSSSGGGDAPPILPGLSPSTGIAYDVADGTLYRRDAGARRWESGSSEDPLQPGDRLRTAGSPASLILDSQGSLLHLDAETDLLFLGWSTHQPSGLQFPWFELRKGHTQGLLASDAETPGLVFSSPSSGTFTWTTQSDSPTRFSFGLSEGPIVFNPFTLPPRFIDVVDSQHIAVIPEPSPILLFPLGLGCLIWILRPPHASSRK